jgi:hypothetical protein
MGEFGVTTGKLFGFITGKRMEERCKFHRARQLDLVIRHSFIGTVAVNPTHTSD